MPVGEQHPAVEIVEIRRSLHRRQGRAGNGKRLAGEGFSGLNPRCSIVRFGVFEEILRFAVQSGQLFYVLAVGGIGGGICGRRRGRIAATTEYDGGKYGG